MTKTECRRVLIGIVLVIAAIAVVTIAVNVRLINSIEDLLRPSAPASPLGDRSLIQTHQRWSKSGLKGFEF